MISCQMLIRHQQKVLSPYSANWVFHLFLAVTLDKLPACSLCKEWGRVDAKGPRGKALPL